MVLLLTPSENSSPPNLARIKSSQSGAYKISKTSQESVRGKSTISQVSKVKVYSEDFPGLLMEHLLQRLVASLGLRTLHRSSTDLIGIYLQPYLDT